MSDIREKLEKIRDDCIKNTIDRAYATGGTPEFDKMYHGFADAILSIVREAVSAVRQRVEKDYEQAKMAHQFRQYEFPEPKEPTVSDFDQAIMEVLS